MTLRSLQARATFAAAAGIVLALVGVGVAVDALAARHLHRSLDHALRQRAIEVAQLSASAPALLTQPGALDSPLGGTQISVEVLDRRGRIVARSLSLGGRVIVAGRLAGAAIADGRASYGTTHAGGDMRLYVAPLAEFGGAAAGGAVVVAAPEHETEQTLASLRLFLVVAGVVGAVLGAAAVAVLIRRALRPLTQLADAAGEVERTGDPARRLPVPRAADEVGRLASTLNAMLASLERSRDAERRFLADASHELRTPLTALRGNVAYLARHGATPELVADLEHDAERLARLADDLLALSREESAATPTEPVRLDALAREALAADPLVDVVAREAVEVRGDRAALERALANLVQNAHAYGPAGGRVTVTVARRNGVAALSVADEGRGLRLEETGLAFRRFWRGRTDLPGSGLGLAIVSATAQRHGGRAYAEDATFTVELPLMNVSEPVRYNDGDPSEKGSP